MKRYRLDQVEISQTGQFLAGIMQGKYIYMGGVGFDKPGERIHTNDGPGGKDWHVHAYRENWKWRSMGKNIPYRRATS